MTSQSFASASGNTQIIVAIATTRSHFYDGPETWNCGVEKRFFLQVFEP